MVQGEIRKITSRVWKDKTYRDLFVLEDGAVNAVQVSLPPADDWKVVEGQTVEVRVEVEARQTNDKSRAFLSVRGKELIKAAALRAAS